MKYFTLDQKAELKGQVESDKHIPDQSNKNLNANSDSKLHMNKAVNKQNKNGILFNLTFI